MTDYTDEERILFDILYRRRSIRAYEDREVEREKIEKLLRAAMAAPSACNLQPWEFIVITQKPAMDRLRDCVDGNNGGNYNAPAAFIVCGNTSYIPWEGDTGVIDCSAAIENLLLAATVLGLGTVWIGAFDGDAVRRAFDIPDPVKVISLVFFGYPAQEKAPRTQYTEEAVYWQKYDPERVHLPRSTPT